MDKTRTSRGLKVLVSVGIVAAVSTVVGAGTFASFNAQAKNPTNRFAAGTLVLSDTKQGGTTCLSTGGGSTDGNSNAACEQLFNATVKRPGDSASANLTIKNEGSLSASVFKVFSTACTDADAAGESYHGTGLPCGKIQLTIQRYSDAAFTVPSACLYGASTLNTCNYSDAAKTLSAFQSAHNSSANGLDVGSGLGSQESAYIQIAVLLPSGADNSFQGRQATTDFNWFVQQ